MYLYTYPMAMKLTCDAFHALHEWAEIDKLYKNTKRPFFYAWMMNLRQKSLKKLRQT